MNYQNVQLGPSITPVVRGLIIANAVVFAIQVVLGWGAISQILPIPIDYLFGLVPELVIRKYFFWQPITYMFLHGSFMHIFLNMLMLWMFGPILEMVMGPRRFLRYYFLCGIGAAIAVLATAPFFGITYSIPTVGASGAIFGVFIAAGILFPNQIVLFFFVLPMRMITVMWLAIAIELLMLWSSNNLGISNTAHLGGALTGFIYFKFFKAKTGGLDIFGSIRRMINRRRQEQIRKRLRLIRMDEEQQPPSKYVH